MKFCARLACQAMRMLVTKKVPRLPWSLDRFHTPVTCAMTRGTGRQEEESEVGWYTWQVNVTGAGSTLRHGGGDIGAR